jgi:flagellar motility protein MotE (MotC chaperone)
MIEMLFGTWRRRIITVLACVLSFFVSLTAAVTVAVVHSPAAAPAAARLPVIGPVAVSIAAWRHGGPLQPEPEAQVPANEEIPTFRDLKPLSAEEIAQLIEDLKAERQLCAERAQQLDRESKRVDLSREEVAKEREQLLALRDKVVSQWEEIKKAREGMDRQVTEIQTLEAKNLKQLAVSYEAMKPERAVLIIKKLDEQTAAKTLFLMRERAAGKIMEQLDQETAARLTERMALMKPVTE